MLLPLTQITPRVYPTPSYHDQSAILSFLLHRPGPPFFKRAFPQAAQQKPPFTIRSLKFNLDNYVEL